jgi:hypothetical protein
VRGRKTGKKELALFGPEGPNNFFALSVFQPRTLAQKKGWGEEYRVNVPLRGPSFLIGL